jgi:Flp pilus assembly protein TadD
VVYLNQLRLNDARFEFLTAIELKQNNQLATLNMVTLLLYQNDWPQAAEIVSRAKLTPEQFTEAQERAEKTQSPGQSQTGHQQSSGRRR